MSQLSLTQLRRLERRVYKKLLLANRGGILFGLDWSSCFRVCPYWASVYLAIHRELDWRYDQN